MAGFGGQTSSAVKKNETDGSSKDKQAVTKFVLKDVEPTKRVQGLLTPDGTPGPDNARLEADRARQQAELDKEASKNPKALGPSEVDATDTTVNEEESVSQASRKTVPPDAPPDDETGAVKQTYTEEQKLAVNRVLKCGGDKYYQILGVNDPCTKEESTKAFKRLALLVHPDKCTHPDAGDAFKSIERAAKALGVPSEDFAENAYGDEGDADDDFSVMDLDEPDDFRKQIYDKATQYLEMLMGDPEDAEVIKALDALNSEIMTRNLVEKLPRKDIQNFLIKVPTFAAHFKTAKPYHLALKRDPNDVIARKKLANTNALLAALNARHGYPNDWLIEIPPKPKGGPSTAESSSASGSKAAGKSDQASTKGGVKTKVSVEIPDESDGRTSLGRVEIVRKAGFGSRVIVNRGTDLNPYFDIYPGAEFGKGVAKEWLESGGYVSKDLPSNTVPDKMKVQGRVEVEASNPKRGPTKTDRTQSPITYYIVLYRGVRYVSTKSTLAGLKKMSPAKLKRIDKTVTRKCKKLLRELDECRENNVHPDTGEQLTDEDIEEMPWLSLDEDPETEDEDDDSEEEDDDSDDDDDSEDDDDDTDDDDDDDEEVVLVKGKRKSKASRSKGLKRQPKSAPASDSPSTSRKNLRKK